MFYISISTLLFSCSVFFLVFFSLLFCLPMGFPRQEYWNELPFPSPGDLPDPGVICIAGRFFTVVPPRKPQKKVSNVQTQHYQIMSEMIVLGPSSFPN